MRILIYGAGALGQAIGGLLAANGHEIDLVLRPRFLETIRENGLRVTGILGEYHAPAGNLGLHTSLAGCNKAYDYILLTTKAYDTATAVADLAGVGTENTIFVSMQNGCGNLEQLCDSFGAERCLGGRVITGFEIIEAGTVTVTVSADAIHIGPAAGNVIPESAECLAEAITKAGHPTLAVADIHQSLFAKLLYNTTLNPLGAILGVHYGVLVEHQETIEIMDKIIEETFAVIQALGGNTPWGDAASYKRVFYESLVPATYNHRPSMLQDLENGKPTEVDALVGYVSSQGKRLGIPTPTCDLLAALVRFKEAHGESETN